MISVMIQVFLALVVILTVWEILYRFKYRKNRKIPGPKGFPVIGNTLEFTPQDVLTQFIKMHDKYGLLTKIRIGFHPPNTILSDPKHVEILLNSQKFIRKADDYKNLRPWLGDGLLTSTGNKWKKHRRMLTPAFHFKILEEFIDVFNSCGNIMIERLEKEAKIGEVFDVYPYITLCALDVICETAMGTSVNAQTDSKSEYVQAVQNMCHLVNRRGFSLWKDNDYLYWFSSEYNTYQKSLKILHDMTKKVITSRRNLVVNKIINMNTTDDFGKKKRMAFLDVLLASTVDGKPLSDTAIREEVDTFMFEGHDTTASAMSFALYSLSNNPRAQELAVTELKEIFGDDKKRPATYQDLNEMKYLEMVIKETLRIYPSVPIFIRLLEDDMDLGDGYIAPKGSYATVFTYHLQRNPAVFPEPEAFRPERFEEQNRHPFIYVPFSAGPRNCIGQKFAMLEMKALLSKVLRNYELLPAGDENKPQVTPKLVLKSDNGMRIKIKLRK